MTQRTGNEEVREIRQIKPEEEVNFTMVMVIFAH